MLDTDVVVAAMRSPSGGSATLLLPIRRGQGTLLLSQGLLTEYEAQCQAPHHRAAAGLDAREIDRFLDSLAVLAEFVEVFFRWRPQLRDPGDEKVLEAAVNGRAGVIVTFNRRAYGDAPGRFGIDVLAPSEVLKRMRT